ncbi:nucleotidyltransferase domain-containing protein [Catellatospora sp. NPDC049111]|uniref:nucleotidyltransferase domain-containing protein n=1 Tax=Catellatospora sp. NPDC049111 TaxID=3155271 RepID=UPI0033F9F18D
MTYREEKLKTALANAEALIDDARADSVYLGGSLTAGLGSPTSDVDVFVLTTDTEAQSGVARQFKVDTERIDLETYTVAWVDSLLDKVGQWESNRQRLRHNALNATELDFLLRLRQIQVIKNSANLDRILARLAEHDDRLRQMALSTWALSCNGWLSDFKGALLDNDGESAGLIGQSVLVCVGKAAAAAAGDLYYGLKWVHQQLHRSIGDAFPHEVFRHWQRGGWATEPATADGLDFLVFQQTVGAAAQLLGWNGPAVKEWPFWETGTGQYRRNPQYNTIHLTEGVLLNYELQRQLVVKPDVALVWALSNGRDEDEIVDAAVALGPHVCLPGEDPLGGDRARELLALLERRGLVSKDLFR